jgi:hypothetical protein
MNRTMAESLTSLLSQAQESTADILRRFEDRLQALAVQPSSATDLTALRRVRELRASQAKLELQEAHRRIIQTVRRMQLEDVITEGEATPCYQELERLLAETLKAIDARLNQGSPAGSARRKVKSPQG